jgi:hypothetical protein
MNKNKEYHKLNGKKYVLRTGQKGGRYIIVNNEKKYIKKIKGGADIDLLNSYQNIVTQQIPYSKKDSNTVYNTHIKIVENKENNIVKDSHNDFKKGKPEDYNFIIESLDKWIDNIPFILKNNKAEKPFFVDWTLSSNATVLIIGDIHGHYRSLTNLIEHWKKSKYIDENYTLNDNIFVISTGDLIDYGNNSINILYFFINLRLKNPGKVMLLAGNHEGSIGKCEVTGVQDFNSEIIRKTTNLFNSSINQTDKNTLIERLKEYIRHIGPVMLSLRFENEAESIYFMHGMYPVYSPDNEKNMTIYNPKTTKVEIWPYKPLDKIKEDLTQWGDVSDGIISKNSVRGGDGSFKLGIDILYPIMRRFGIKGFIRGHQDNCPAQLYPYTVNNKEGKDVYCANTAAINFGVMSPDIIDPTQIICKHKENDNWCIYETNYYGIPNIDFININSEPDLKNFIYKTFLNENNKEDNTKNSNIYNLLINYMANRIITISMAGGKFLAPMGGYVILTVTKLNTQCGGKIKTKLQKLNKNILKYTPYGGNNNPLKPEITKYPSSCKLKA